MSEGDDVSGLDLLIERYEALLRAGKGKRERDEALACDLLKARIAELEAEIVVLRGELAEAHERRDGWYAEGLRLRAVVRALEAERAGSRPAGAHGV